MPIFSVRLTTNVSKEFLINAASRQAAEQLAQRGAAAVEAEIENSKSVKHIRTDSDTSASVYDADESLWSAPTAN